MKTPVAEVRRELEWFDWVLNVNLPVRHIDGCPIVHERVGGRAAVHASAHDSLQRPPDGRAERVGRRVAPALGALLGRKTPRPALMVDVELAARGADRDVEAVGRAVEAAGTGHSDPMQRVCGCEANQQCERQRQRSGGTTTHGGQVQMTHTAVGRCG